MTDAIPKTMKAVVCNAEGKLVDEQLPVPQPGKGEVLVRVAVSGINPVDYKIVHNHVPLGRPRPTVPGCDCAGTVVQVGEGITRFKVGDEVFGMTGGLQHGPEGTLAEYVIALEPMITKKPTGISMREAAAAPLATLTAWEGIVDRMQVKPGQTVLVVGASGGVGHLAVQIAVARGAKVFGLASEGKRDLVERYGATFVDYKKPEQLDDVVATQTVGGAGFDVVFETFGAPWIQKALQLVAPHGYISEINGFTSEDLSLAGFKGVAMCFPMTCLPYVYPTPQWIGYMGGLFEQAAMMMEDNKLRPVVDDALNHPFSAAGVEAAYADLQSGKNRGKMVINISA